MGNGLMEEGALRASLIIHTFTLRDRMQGSGKQSCPSLPTGKNLDHSWMPRWGARSGIIISSKVALHV